MCMCVARSIFEDERMFPALDCVKQYYLQQHTRDQCSVALFCDLQRILMRSTEIHLNRCRFIHMNMCVNARELDLCEMLLNFETQ